MSDIFDDVEKILAEEETSEVTSMESSDNAEDSGSFNESELEDIMAEIESLESDFTEVAPEALKTDSSVAPKTDLQKEIDNEMAKVMPEAAVEPVVADVLPFEKTKSVSVVEAPKSEMSFEANGSMNIVLNFKLGDEMANLKIDEVRGLVVTLNGVELCLNDKNGCTVTMENGVNFNIPLTTKVSSSKKNAA